MTNPSEALTEMSLDELDALAECLLAPAAQGRLDELLARRKATPLTDSETAELDGILRKADQLTILKTRARYTLKQRKAQVART